MNEILENEHHEPQKENRPTMLLVLVILSFLNIGWSLLSNIASLVSGPMNEEDLEASKVEMTKGLNEIRGQEGLGWLEEFIRGAMDMIEATNANHSLSVLSGIIILLIGVAGVFLMFTGRKLGFHTYIIYSFLAAVQVYLFVSPSLFSNTIVIFSLIISAIFILLYAQNLKWMK